MPFALSPVRPLVHAILTFCTVTFGASMLRQPVMFWQLITVFAVVMRIVRLAAPLLTVSVLPAQAESTGPVFDDAGHPHAARFAHT